MTIPIIASVQPKYAIFTTKIRDDTVSLNIFSIFLMPNKNINLSILDNDLNRQFNLNAGEGKSKQVSRNSWQWQAPEEKGLTTVKLFRTLPMDSLLINVFVMVPYEQIKDEYLNQYQIGHYPSQPLKTLSVYEIPQGFIEVTAENQEIWISPHFQLKQFLCKQSDGFPQYVVLNERLLLLLERILERTNQAGYPCQTFHIMSGYRTPYYNHLIGNVPNSCHLYGVAADFFIDEHPKDGIMDDLDGNGKSDIADAGIIYNLILGMTEESWFKRFRGGLAKYGSTSSHGPFVHVDVRGYQARWGK
jgi:hypothetical protein